MDFQACLFAGLLFHRLDLVAMRIRPARIHPRQHGGPVLAFGAAGTGVDFQEGVIAVSLAGEQRLQLGAAHTLGQLLQAGHSLLDHVRIVFHFGKLDDLDRVGQLALGFDNRLDRRLQTIALAHQQLGLLGIVPEVRGFGFRVQLVKAFLGSIPVKDASSAGPLPAGFRRIGSGFQVA